VVLAFTAGFEFIGLVTLTSAVNLAVFTVVNLALWKLHRSPPPPALTLHVPRWCPPLAAACSIGLLLAQFVF
jgi:amino acid transporter